MDIPPIVEELAAHLRARLQGSSERLIVGIAGAPGTGKSTLAEAIQTAIGADAVVLPMDGFHLGEAVLNERGIRDRKGAIDTFDSGGYLSLLTRIRARDEDVVYAPQFRRDLEEPIAASIAIPRETPIILTEGNYLLAEQRPWDRVLGLLDEAWYVDTPSDIRLAQLIRRHIAFGKTPEAAEAWARGTDEANARLIETTKDRADRVVPWP